METKPKRYLVTEFVTSEHMRSRSFVVEAGKDITVEEVADETLSLKADMANVGWFDDGIIDIENRWSEVEELGEGKDFAHCAVIRLEVVASVDKSPKDISDS